MRSIPPTLPLLLAALACGREVQGRPGAADSAPPAAAEAAADPWYDPKGQSLVVQDTEPADSAQRLIVETDGQRVVRYRAGITPAVEYVEGCA
jgi:hypothetical protein